MTELPKTYDAALLDPKWSAFWEKNTFFRADPYSEKPAFSLIMPPPNITGRLHMGHALVNTLQDVLVRWKRMCGFETLWIPGTDHAGISTQTVVEKELIRTQNKRRKDFLKEEFLAYVWAWKEQNESMILDQVRRLGCSCDWSRLRFTMDAGNNRVVRKVFKKLFEEGLIYRGDYLVNWDPVTQTALSDDEVEYEERVSSLWYIRYPFVDGSGFVTIATTRPETMLGDTAVAVSPEDERYVHRIGHALRLPLTGRDIPLIGDFRVDPQFGTGAVKVTPAHDPLDYQIGLTHGLPQINILTPDGRINERGGKFARLSIEEARIAIVEELRTLGLLEKTEPHTHRVGLSYRSKAVVEPYLSKQWFVKMEGFGLSLKEALSSGSLSLIPPHWEKTYLHWIENLRDWCISRQLWWGHQIPIWYHVDDPSRVLCFDGEGTPPEVEKAPSKWRQDEDVLDTWFSSALWPFSTLDWPESSPFLEKFYPNSVLVTGHDILFFWVARMLFMGKYVTGQLPFSSVFLHGLIYGKSYWKKEASGDSTYIHGAEKRAFDEGKSLPPGVFSKWEKMSKTKGNIIDPLEMIEKYGTDSVRMALAASATQARQIDLDQRRFEEFKNFTTKLWNGARFVLMHLKGDPTKEALPLTPQAFSQGIRPQELLLEDRWILSLIAKTVQEVTGHLHNYQFDQAAQKAYNFFWKEFCAYYVEISKPILNGKFGTLPQRETKQKVLALVLSQSIRLLHPIAPFVTEELFHVLKEQLAVISPESDADSLTKEVSASLQARCCATSLYPTPHTWVEEELIAHFACIEELVYTIRNLRGEMQLGPGVSTSLFLVVEREDADQTWIEEHQNILRALVPVDEILFCAEPPSGFSAMAPFRKMRLFLPLPSHLLAHEKARLLKESEKLQSSLDKLSVQLQNPDFLKRAPAPVIDHLQKQRSEATSSLAVIHHKLRSLSC